MPAEPWSTSSPGFGRATEGMTGEQAEAVAYAVDKLSSAVVELIELYQGADNGGAVRVAHVLRGIADRLLER